jgi:hypothetical protein
MLSKKVKWKSSPSGGDGRLWALCLRWLVFLPVSIIGFRVG